MELKRLKIDGEFRHLIRPLRHREFLQLEQNIINDGCRDPIVVWHDTIVDGHNRYEICMRHSIPFDTKDMEFECREAAVAWICANQLGRRNITEETRKFLIGMQYENEKLVTRIRNKIGRNQHTLDISTMDEEDADKACRHWTAQRIAEDNRYGFPYYSVSTLYGAWKSRSFDRLCLHELKSVIQLFLAFNISR